MLGDIVMSQILPVASKYESILLDKVYKMQQIGLDGDADVALLKEIQHHSKLLHTLVHDMIEARKVANRIDDQRAKAVLYHDTVAIFFDEIRNHIDQIGRAHV